jgi:hypothetical protein
MTRQEFLLNLALLTIIGALAYVMVSQGPDEVTDVPVVASATPVPPKTETEYLQAGKVKYPEFGNKNIYVAILPTIPPPPPPPPSPAPTPDIHTALKPWRLMGILDNEVSIEDKSKANDPENQFFTMKKGDSRPVDTGKTGLKNVRISALDAESDNPSVTFEMDETSEKHILKTLDDGSGGAPAPEGGAPPPAPAPGPAPAAAPAPAAPPPGS